MKNLDDDMYTYIYKNGEINVILENGEKLLLPNIINKVPSLLLMNRGHRVLTGNEIMDYLIPPVQQNQQQNRHRGKHYEKSKKNLRFICLRRCT